MNVFLSLRAAPQAGRRLWLMGLGGLGAGAALASFGRVAQALGVGQPAPELSAEGPQGPLRLAQFRGQFVYLDFWASWCGPCRQSFPWLNTMHERYAAQNLRIVAINVDQRREDAQRFLARHPANFLVAYDSEGQTPRAYAVKTMPSSVLIDGQGRVLMRHQGFREEEAPALEAELRRALGLGRS